MNHINEVLEEVRNCSEEKRLFEYARSSLPGVAIEVARSLHATPAILDILTNHVSIVVRHAVAQNPQTGEETLKRLISDKDQLVRDYARINLRKRGIHVS